MPKRRKRTKRPARKKRAGQVSDARLLADAKKVLRKEQKVLETELKAVKRYIKDLDGHNSFTI